MKLQRNFGPKWLTWLYRSRSSIRNRKRKRQVTPYIRRIGKTSLLSHSRATWRDNLSWLDPAGTSHIGLITNVTIRLLRRKHFPRNYSCDLSGYNIWDPSWRRSVYHEVTRSSHYLSVTEHRGSLGNRAKASVKSFGCDRKWSPTRRSKRGASCSHDIRTTTSYFKARGRAGPRARGREADRHCSNVHIYMYIASGRINDLAREGDRDYTGRPRHLYSTDLTVECCRFFLLSTQRIVISLDTFDWWNIYICIHRYKRLNHKFCYCTHVTIWENYDEGCKILINLDMFCEQIEH